MAELYFQDVSENGRVVPGKELYCKGVSRIAHGKKKKKSLVSNKEMEKQNKVGQEDKEFEAEWNQ